MTAGTRRHEITHIYSNRNTQNRHSDTSHLKQYFCSAAFYSGGEGQGLCALFGVSVHPGQSLVAED